MIAPQPISLLNTGLPLLLLAILAVALPRLLLPATNISHQALALAVALSALLLLAVGACLIALAYAGNGLAVGQAFLSAKAAVTLFFLRLSAITAIIWGPLLALTWFAMAQGIERRKGERVARKDRR